MNGEMFLAWVQQGLAPVLQPGDVVILDNLSTHKVSGVREAIASVGARLLFLPPYIHRISTLSKTSGAKSSRAFEAKLRAPNRN
jgi:transposase